MKTLFFSALILSFLSGCAAPSYQRLVEAPYVVPETARIEGVPYLEQTVHHCGPASLAMVMGWTGKPVSVEALAKKAFTPGAKGSLQWDLVGAARREGQVAVAIDSFEALLKEVAAGHPVIIFENLGLSWYPMWHYAVVVGYDLPRRQVTLHSADEAYLHEGIKAFDFAWAYSDRWGLVVLPPTELSATGDEIAHLQAAAGLERVDRKGEAAIAYRTLLSKWPHSLGALVGLGNLNFIEKRFPLAVSFLEEASRFHPKVPAVWHNLALAYAETKQPQRARRSAQEAMRLVGPRDAAFFRKNLQEYLPPSAVR